MVAQTDVLVAMDHVKVLAAVASVVAAVPAKEAVMDVAQEAAMVINRQDILFNLF